MSKSTFAILRILNSQLVSLGKECKKYPNILEKTILGSKDIEKVNLEMSQAEGSKENIQKMLVQRLKEEQSIVNPFIQGCETLDKRIVNVCLGALQQLLLYNALSWGALSFVVDTLSRLSLNADNFDDQTMLKLVQLALTILTSKEITLNQVSLSKLFGLCFRMNSSKVKSVQITSDAAIRQASSLIFDALSQVQSGNDSTEDVLFSSANSAFLYLSDLCLLALKQEAKWMKIKNSNSEFILDLLNEIVKNYSDSFMQYPDFQPLLETKFPLIISQYVPEAIEHNLVIPACNLSSSFLRLAKYPLMEKSCIELMKPLSLTLVNSSTPLWKKVLILECYREFCENRTLAQHVIWFGSERNLITEIMRDLEDFVDRLEIASENFQYSQHQFRRLSDPTSIRGFVSTEEEALAVCMDSLVGLVTTISTFVADQPSESGTGDKSIDSQVQTQTEHSISRVTALIQVIWGSMEKTLYSLLSLVDDEDTLHLILQTYLLFIHSCAITGESILEAFMTDLRKFCPVIQVSTTPNTSIHISSPLSMKNILVQHTLVDIAQKLGESLGKKAWTVVLRVFQDLDLLINCSSAFKANAQEIKTFQNALKQIFSRTVQYSDQAFLTLVDTLCSFPISSHLYASHRLIDVILYNKQRINLVWVPIQSHLLKLIESDESSVRQQAVQYFLRIVEVIFDSSVPKEPNYANLELEIFSIMYTISSSRYFDVKEQMISALSDLIEAVGECLSKSWTIILTVLRSIDDGNVKVIQKAFAAVEMIGKYIQYLSVDGLMEYMHTVQFFALQTKIQDFNISLVALSLFWNLSDFMVKKFSEQHKRSAELWLTLFTTLRKSTVDERPEVRHSAIRTLMFAVASHGSNMNQQTWELVLEKVLIPLLQEVEQKCNTADSTQKKENNMHHSRNSEQKQWSETRSLVIEGISRVVKEHSKVLQLIPMFNHEAAGIISRHILDSLNLKSREIAKTSVKAYSDMLKSTSGVAQRAIWDGAWKLWSYFSQCSINGESFISSHLLTEMIDDIIVIYQETMTDQRKEIFTQEDMILIPPFLNKILNSKNAQNLISHPSPCQKSILVLYGHISRHSEFVNNLVIQSLIKLFPSRKDIIQFSKEIDTLGEDPFTDDMPHQKVLQAILELILDVSFPEIPLGKSPKPEVFISVVEVLSRGMFTKVVGNTYPIWKISINLFATLVKKELPALMESDKLEIVSKSISEAISQFLFDLEVKKVSDSPEETSLISLIEDTIFMQQNLSTEMRQNYLQILNQATYSAPRSISFESMNCLFRIVDSATVKLNREDLHEDHVLQTAYEVVPILFRRCQELIRSYIKDDKLTGQMPLAQYRLTEILQLFQNLKTCLVHQKFYYTLPNLNRMVSKASLASNKGLLICLFPDLCEFAITEDSQIRVILVELLRDIHQALGFSLE